MKQCLACCLLLVSLTGSAQKKQPALRWTQLFNGKDLRNWTIKIKDHPLNENFGNTFRVRDGLLTVSYDQYDGFKEQYGHIFYNKKFSAYLLRFEYRFIGDQVKGGAGWALRNSGAMLQSPAPETMRLEQDFPISLEMQILGGNGTTPRHTGNLCTPGTNVVLDGKLFKTHCVDSKSATYHGEQWVTAGALVLRDSVIRHIVAGDTVLSYNKPQYDGRDTWVQKAGLPDGSLISEGFISLQSESHPVQFRKVEIFDLSKYINDPKKLAAVLDRLRTNK